MARTKRIFISDIHLGDDERYDDPDEAKRPRFEPETEGPRLLNFLDKQVLAKQSQVRDLVLLGDIFDTWVCPFDVVPSTYPTIFESQKNATVINALKRIAETDINLYYVNGNHDYDLTKKQIEDRIPGLRHLDRYTDEALRLYAEHGHRYTLFNRSDDQIADGLPIGYFITRFAEHMGKGIKKYIRGWKDLASYFDDFFEFASGEDNLFVSILEGLAERAGADKVIMAADKSLSLEEIKQAYAPLGEKIPPFKAGAQLASERDLERYGDRICRDENFKAVVFGHTHEAKIDKDAFLVADRIYANSGSWCGTEAHCVVVEEDAPTYAMRVQVMKVDAQGEMSPVGDESV